MSIYLSSKHNINNTSIGDKGRSKYSTFIDEDMKANLKKLLRCTVKNDIFCSVKFLPSDWVEKCTNTDDETKLGGKIKSSLVKRAPKEIKDLFLPSSTLNETAWMYCLDALPTILSEIRSKVTMGIRKKWQRGMYTIIPLLM